MILKHAFTPLNNTRLSHLCGPMDEHLRTIEMALSVKISHRGEQFRVEGPKAQAQRAIDTLQSMYEMAGRSIPRERVQLMVAGDVPRKQTNADAVIGMITGETLAGTGPGMGAGQ